MISLLNEPSIITKKADKSTTLVVQNRANYMAEGLGQFNDGIHYAEIHKDKTQDIHSLVNSVVSEMCINSNNDNIIYKYLSQPLKFHSDRLYLLPKIHKISVLDIEKFKGCEAL